MATTSRWLLLHVHKMKALVEMDPKTSEACGEKQLIIQREYEESPLPEAWRMHGL